MKKILSFAAALLLSAALIPILSPAAILAAETEEEKTPTVEYYKGKALKVETVTYLQDPTLLYNEVHQTCEIKLLTGKFANRVYTVENVVNTNDPDSFLIDVNDKVVMYAELTDDELEISSIHVYSHYRVNFLMYAAIISLALLFVLCGLKAAKVVICVVIYAAAFIFFVSPLMAKGITAAILMVPVLIAMGTVCLLFDYRATTRGVCIGAGTAIGVIIAGLIGWATESLGAYTGLGETEFTMLMYTPHDGTLNYGGLAFALSMTVSMFVLLNTCSCVCEQMYEAKYQNPYMGMKELFVTGITQGKKTVTDNALILIFVSLVSVAPTWVVYAAYGTEVLQMLNMDFHASQLFRMFACIIGVCVGTPASVFLYSLLAKGKSLY